MRHSTVALFRSDRDVGINLVACLRRSGYAQAGGNLRLFVNSKRFQSTAKTYLIVDKCYPNLTPGALAIRWNGLLDLALNCFMQLYDFLYIDQCIFNKEFSGFIQFEWVQ